MCCTNKADEVLGHEDGVAALIWPLTREATALVESDRCPDHMRVNERSRPITDEAYGAQRPTLVRGDSPSEKTPARSSAAQRTLRTRLSLEQR